MSDSITINVTEESAASIVINDTGENIYLNPLTLNQGVINHSVTHQFGGSDELLHNLLGGLYGGQSGQYYHLSSGQYFNLVTGDVVRPSETGDFITISQTGAFYPSSNPSGFITGVDLSAYVTGDVVRPSQTGNFVTTNQTGDFYPSSNPSGFITGVDLSAYVTGDVVRPSQTGNFITTSQTGAFYSNSNPSGFITGVNLNAYATINFTTGISGYLQGQIDSINTITGDFYPSSNPSGFITGVDLSNYATGDVVRPSETGDFITTSQTGQFYPNSNPSGFITGVDLSPYVTGDVIRPSDTGAFYASSNPSGFITGVDLSLYATQDFTTGISGSLQSQISSLSNQTGSYVLNSETGQFYPSSNPSGFITGVDLSSYATIPYVTGISGDLQSGITNSLNNYLPLSGGIITGALSIESDLPTLTIKTNFSAPLGNIFTINDAGTDVYTVDNYGLVKLSSLGTPSDSWILNGTIDSTYAHFTKVYADEIGINVETPTAALDILDTTLAVGGSLNGSAVNIRQTWNTSGTPTAFKLNITDTSSNTLSLLMDLQVGGVSKFSVRKTGSINIGSGNSYIAGSLLQTSGNIYAGGSFVLNTANQDVWLHRDAAGILAQRNATNAQTFRLYNTYTSTTNFECLDFRWDANTAKIGTHKGSVGGVARDLVLETDTVERLRIASFGDVGIGTSPVCRLDIAKTWNSNISVTGASGTGSVATLTFATQAAVIPVGSTIVVASVNPTAYNGTFIVTASTLTSVSYASTATATYVSGGTIQQLFTGVKLNITDTASNASSLLMDLQVGGISQTSIRKDGIVNIGNNIGSLLPAANSKGIFFGARSAQNLGASLLLNADDTLTLSVGFGSGKTFSIANSIYSYIFTNGAFRINNGSGDSYISSDAANSPALRNGANAQTFRIYGTYTNSSNFRRIALTMSTAGVAELKPEGSGTGATGNVIHISGIPTSNPGAGILWNDGGTVKVGT